MTTQETDAVLVDVVKYMRHYYYNGGTQANRCGCDVWGTNSIGVIGGRDIVMCKRKRYVVANRWIDAIKEEMEDKDRHDKEKGEK
jgi:hypothetical protein